MGYGPVVGGKQKPITKWENSWAHQEQQRREGKMKEFRIGDRVKKIMGVRLVGTVTRPFRWNESTDGTYKLPEKDHIPVLWDDGTKGYIQPCFLEHEVK